MAWKKAVGLGVCGAALLAVSGCCEKCLREMKRERPAIEAMIINAYRDCCSNNSDPDEQASCMSDVIDRTNTATGMLTKIWSACEQRKWEKAKELWESLRNLFPNFESVAVRDDGGRWVNSVPVLLEGESVAFAASASRRAVAADAAVYVGGDVYSTDAAGNAQAMIVEAGEEAAVLHVPASDADAVLFSRYRMNAGSTVDISGPGFAVSLGVSGWFEVSELQQRPGGGARAAVSALDLSLASQASSETMDFYLIASHPGSEVVIDQNGVGTLTAVGRLISSTQPQFEVLHDEVVIRLPVSFSADRSGVSISAAGRAPLAADDVTPTIEPGALNPQPGGHPGCNDDDSNGVPDQADAVIQTIRDMFDQWSCD